MLNFDDDGVLIVIVIVERLFCVSGLGEGG